MNLFDTEIVARQHIKLYIPNYRFKWFNRKQTFGMCSSREKIIYLSKSLCLANDLDRIKDTILHEIAHALAPKDGHNFIWEEVFKTLGGSGRARFDETNTNVIKGRFKYKCGNCGFVRGFFRRIKRSYACPHCCKKYNSNRYTDKFKLRRIE